MIKARKVVAQWLGKIEEEAEKKRIFLQSEYYLRELFEALAKRSEPAMDRFTASEALGCMEAYYKVSSGPFSKHCNLK